jgi:uncharacterized protein (TIGR03437 family)
MWARLVAAGLCWTLGAGAQDSAGVFIETVAGSGVFDQRPARETPLIQPQAVAVTPSGDLVVSDGNFLIRRVRGAQTAIVAGGGALVDDAEGVDARQAKLDYPSGIAVSSDGAIYFADVRHHRVRCVTPDGRITTVAGRGTPGYSGDGGPGLFADLNLPTALTLSPSGEVVIADTGNYAVRAWDPGTRRIRTIAGTGKEGNSGDGGPARSATFGVIRALAYDPQGNLYIADRTNRIIRRVAPDGTITRFAGTGQPGFSGDGGPATQARLGWIFGMAANQRGLFVADADAGRVRLISPQGIISTYAGGATRVPRETENVPATEITLKVPSGLALDTQGHLYITDTDSHLIRRVDANTRTVTNVAGALRFADNLPAAETPLYVPGHVAVDNRGNVFFAENGSFRVRRLDALSGAITTIAGNGREGFRGQPESSVSLGGKLGVSVDALGRVLIADSEVGVIRRYDPATGQAPVILDLNRFPWERSGPRPRFALAAPDGNIFISEWQNDVVLRLAPDGTLWYFAGIEGETGYSGDGGPAVEATLNGPEGLALDSRGGLLLCDADNHVVRRVDLASRVIQTFAGDGIDNYDFDGFAATLASLRRPVALAINEGFVFIADEDANVVRFVDPDGIINTITGNELAGFSGDGGLALFARLDTPMGLAFFRNTLLIGDSRNYRLRRLFVRQVANPLQISETRLTFRAAEGGDPPSEQLLIVTSSVLGLNLNYTIGGSLDVGEDWLYVDSLEGQTPHAIIVSVDTKGLTAGRYTGRIWVKADNGSEATVRVELVVTPPGELRTVQLSADLLQLAVSSGGTGSGLIAVSAPGGQVVPWTIRLLTESPWLKLSARQGTTPTNLQVEADAGSLPPGVYTAVGYVEVPEGASTLFVILLKVEAARPSILLDRSALVFETVQGSTSVADQTLSILNNGGAPLSWTLAVPGRQAWLRVSAAAGELDPRSPPAAVRVSVNAADLAPGDYTAVLSVAGEDALGSPQPVTVRLRVRPAGAAGRAILETTALAFFGAPGARIPNQTIELGTTGGAVLTFSASANTANGGRWLTVTPAEGALQFSAQRARLEVSVSASGLRPEDYREVPGCPAPAYCGKISLSFSDGSLQEVTVLLVLRGSAGVERTGVKERHSSCVPSRQLVLSPTLAGNFTANASWPLTLRARVVDDCGEPIVNANVTAAFSNGDPPMTLANLRNGDYSATWTPIGAAANTVVTFKALHPSLAAAELRTGGRVAATASDPPAVAAGGVLNAASRRRASLIAPRGLIAIQGANFPEDAADVQVLIGGQVAEVVSSSAVEILAVAPEDVAQRRSTTVLVSARGFLSAPEIVSVAPVDPGLFPLPEGATPVAGATLEIEAAGLGAVDENGGVLAPVTARFGDAEAEVETAVALPERPGRYRIAIRVPGGIAGERKLTIAQGGSVSNELTLSVQGESTEGAR